MSSKFLRLNTRDFIRGLIVVVICTLITGMYQLIANGGTINWLTVKPVVIAALGSAVSYLTKNLLTNSKGDFMKTEPGEKH
jgi:glycosyltransferase involved in cell wall biosynthesis